MIRSLAFAALAAAMLGGCVTDYAYRGGPGDYYYGRPSVEYSGYGAPYGSLYAYPGGWSFGLGLGYGYGYGYPGYGWYGGYPYYPPYYWHRPHRPHYRPPPESGGAPRVTGGHLPPNRIGGNPLRAPARLPPLPERGASPLLPPSRPWLDGDAGPRTPRMAGPSPSSRAPAMRVPMPERRAAPPPRMSSPAPVVRERERGRDQER